MAVDGRAFGYCRVSTRDQAEGGTSIRQQAEALEGYCKAQGWLYAGVFIDDVSGTTTDRPGLRALLDEVVTGDRVLVLKLDRWARNVRQALTLLDDLEACGVAFVSVRDGIDTTTPGGRLMRTILLAMAEWEGDVIFERVDAGRRGAVAIKGRRGNGRIPYGYLRGATPGTVEIDPATAPVVRRIHAERGDGSTFQAIADGLNREGVPTPQGGIEWRPGSVRTIAANTFYTGTVSYGKRPQGKRTRDKPPVVTTNVGRHEPLVSVN